MSSLVGLCRMSLAMHAAVRESYHYGIKVKSNHSCDDVKLHLGCSNTVKKQKQHSVMLLYDSGTIILHQISVWKPLSNCKHY